MVVETDFIQYYSNRGKRLLTIELSSVLICVEGSWPLKGRVRE